MSLAVDVRLRRRGFELDVRVEVPEGQVLAVLGPNASGKSTLLGVFAGLLRPDEGSVTWRGRDLTRVPGRTVPPRRRRVGLLGQDPLLFPHLSVLENVAFGPRSRGHRAPAARAHDWLARLDLADLAGRRPREISGGQAARVALARALAAEPEVLLLDEPLAALDVASAPELRQRLADAVRETGTTTVLVSHDLLDAVVLADRVAVLRDGAVVEEGPREVVFAAPRTAFTAALVGVNLLDAVPEDGGYRTAVGRLRTQARSGDGATQLRFRPAAVAVTAQEPAAPNRWRARVGGLEPATGGVRVRLRHADGVEVLADLEAGAAAGGLLRPGAEVWAHVAPAAVQPVRTERPAVSRSPSL